MHCRCDSRGGLGAVAILLSALALAGCGGDDPVAIPTVPTSTPVATATPSPTPAVSGVIVLSPEGEDLNAYDPADGFRKQAVISGNEDESRPDIPAVNGEVCFDPKVRNRFVVADDATQPNPPPHWSIMELHGEHVGALSFTKLGTLTPTYQAGNADPLGCGFLADGRLLTTDIGNDAAGAATGQLTLWFTPIDGSSQRYCKLDVAIGTAGAIYVDAEDRVYVASARGAPGIYRYSPPFPTSDDAAGGCGGVDSTGAPLADEVHRERFIVQDANVIVPNAVVASGRGTFYVSSVLNGVIGEYDAGGHFLRRILEPPKGEQLGARPFSTGTPFGLAVDASGTLYYSDLGLVVSVGGIGPGPRTGSVRRIRFVEGEPQAPEAMDSDLAFPDGLGLFEP